MITTRKHKFEISVFFHGTKCSKWNKENAHCHHIVRFKVGDNFIDYDYWASLSRPRVEVNDLPSILECIGNDLLDSELDFRSFCFQYGYDEDSIKDYDLWKTLRKIRLNTLRFLKSPDINYTMRMFTNLILYDKIPKKELPKGFNPRKVGDYSIRWSKTWKIWQVFKGTLNLYKEFKDINDALNWAKEQKNV